MELMSSSMEAVHNENKEEFSTSSSKRISTNNLETHEVLVDEPSVGMIFESEEESFLYYAKYARQNGFAVAKKTSKKDKDGVLRNVTLECSRGGKAKKKTAPKRPRPQTKIQCPARLNLARNPDGRWRLNGVTLAHNHELNTGNYRFHKSNLILEQRVKRKKSCRASLDANNNNLLNHGKNPRKLMDFARGDFNVLQNYFRRMRDDNSNFFYSMDFDETSKLRTVFWADARSRAACKEFGDVVKFDTNYLINNYQMPLASFTAINHHGQPILLGCALISDDSTKSYSWLFNVFTECMWSCAPHAIITDRCMAMKNAIQQVFVGTKHRWCVWDILKKIPEKFGKNNACKSILHSLHALVSDSLTVEEFESDWDVFVNLHELRDHEWLNGLYLERERWVPCFLKDTFWAGMSSVQRKESLDRYFDGYVNSETTLKEFIDQYDNILAKKVELERNEDIKCSQSFIPTIIEDELEKQFQRVYTHMKVKEFQQEFIKKLNCSIGVREENDFVSKYEILEWVSIGEENRRNRVSFLVDFNNVTNETSCNCKLFEFRGIVCKHQLMTWHDKGVGILPEKYVLRRWRKDVKRAHMRVEIKYAKLPIWAIRRNSFMKLVNEIADLIVDDEEKFLEAVSVMRELKEKFMKSLSGCRSNVV